MKCSFSWWHMGLRFFKLTGCGNDFVVIDNRHSVLPEAPDAFARRVCARRTGVGADGLLLIEPSERADFRLRIFNPDGSEAEMCGNGARCAARFAVEHGIAGAQMSFETLAGLIRASASDDLVTISMADVALPDTEVTLKWRRRQWTVHPIESGVPHAIIFVDDVDLVDVEGVGRAIRHHTHFRPRGTNVDFVQVVGPGKIRIRTYERGVEAETLACGTGAIGSAIVSHLRAGAGGPPLDVRVQGGMLRVDFRLAGGCARDVSLTGDAVLVFTGELP